MRYLIYTVLLIRKNRSSSNLQKLQTYKPINHLLDRFKENFKPTKSSLVDKKQNFETVKQKSNTFTIQLSKQKQAKLLKPTATCK